MVEQRHHGRAQEHRVGQVEAVRVIVGQALDQPDHVVGHVAEQAGTHQRQALGQLDPALRDQLPQAVQCRLGAGLESVAVEPCPPVDLGPVAAAAPDQVRLDAQDGVAAADGAAGDALEQEAVGPALGELEQRRDRCLQVSHQRGRHAPALDRAS